MVGPGTSEERRDELGSYEVSGPRSPTPRQGGEERSRCRSLTSPPQLNSQLRVARAVHCERDCRLFAALVLDKAGGDPSFPEPLGSGVLSRPLPFELLVGASPESVRATSTMQ